MRSITWDFNGKNPEVYYCNTRGVLPPLKKKYPRSQFEMIAARNSFLEKSHTEKGIFPIPLMKDLSKVLSETEEDAQFSRTAIIDIPSETELSFDLTNVTDFIDMDCQDFDFGHISGDDSNSIMEFSTITI